MIKYPLNAQFLSNLSAVYSVICQKLQSADCYDLTNEKLLNILHNLTQPALVVLDSYANFEEVIQDSSTLDTSRKVNLYECFVYFMCSKFMDEMA